jgi:hypothetical protein
MSTKTTIKRIALVAAVAAAFGGLSTVAANATAGATLATQTGTSIVNNAAGLSSTSSDVVGSYSVDTITAYSTDHVYQITSTGVGILNFAPAPSAGVAASTPVAAVTTAGVAQNYSVSGSTSATWYAGTTIGGTAFGSPTSTLTFSAYSATAGTQTITVTGDVTGAVSETITWGAAPTVSVSNSSVYISNTVLNDTSTVPNTVLAATFPTANASVLAAKTALTGVAASTNSVATVFVHLKDNSASGGSNMGPKTVSATVTGAGLVDGYTDGSSAWLHSPAKGASAITTSAGLAAFQVYPDGTAGTSSIAITYTDASGVTTTLGTVTLIFYGSSPAALKVTQNAFVGAAGDIISSSGVNTETDKNTGDGAVTVSATDANGNPVAGLSAVGSAATSTAGWTVSSDNTACVTNTLNAANIVAGDGSNSLADAVGTYEIDFNAASGAASGCVAHVTLGYYVSSTSAALTSTPVTVTIGKTTVNSIALTTDASSYAPGEKVKYILTATDSAGNPVADGYYGLIAGTSTTAQGTNAIGGLALNTNLPSTPWAVAAGAAGVAGYSGIFFSNGKAVASTYAPYYSGTVTGTLTLADSTSYTGIAAALEATALTASFAVTSPTDSQASAATDAANEATDAANAATDAANAAADAADAATSAAQDAGAKADAALAAVTALSAKITVLAAQIAKIVKKLKA